MDVKLLLICCLLHTANADVRDAVSRVAVKVDHGGLLPPQSHTAELRTYGSVGGSAIDSSSHTLEHSAGAQVQNSQHDGTERGDGNNVFFHARIGDMGHNSGSAISTQDRGSFLGSIASDRDASSLGPRLHVSGSVRANIGGTDRDERIQDLIGALPCCGENKNVGSQPGGFVASPQPSLSSNTGSNTGGHSGGYANLIGKLPDSNIGTLDIQRSREFEVPHSSITSDHVRTTVTGQSMDFNNLIGTLHPSNTGSNVGDHSAGFGNLIGTIQPSNTGSNAGGHSAGFGNLIGTLTPSVANRYSSELGGFQSTTTSSNIGRMATDHSAGFGNLIGTLQPGNTGRNSGFTNLIGTLKPSDTGSNVGHSAEYSRLPISGSFTARGFSGMPGHMTFIQAGHIPGLVPETQQGLSVSHVPTHTGEFKDFPKPAHIQSFGHQVSVTGTNAFSSNKGEFDSSYRQVESFPASIMSANVANNDRAPSRDIPRIQGQHYPGISESHTNYPITGRDYSQSVSFMPERYNVPSVPVNYQIPAVLPASMPSNFGRYQGPVATGGVGSYRGPVTEEYRTYSGPTTFGHSGGHGGHLHNTYSSSHANSNAGGGHEEFEGY